MIHKTLQISLNCILIQRKLYIDFDLYSKFQLFCNQFKTEVNVS